MNEEVKKGNDTKRLNGKKGKHIHQVEIKSDIKETRPLS